MATTTTWRDPGYTEQLAAISGITLEPGGNVVIPSPLPMGRTQELPVFVQEMKEQRR